MKFVVFILTPSLKSFNIPSLFSFFIALNSFVSLTILGFVTLKPGFTSGTLLRFTSVYDATLSTSPVAVGVLSVLEN